MTYLELVLLPMFFIAFAVAGIIIAIRVDNGSDGKLPSIGVACILLLSLGYAIHSSNEKAHDENIKRMTRYVEDLRKTGENISLSGNPIAFIPVSKAEEDETAFCFKRGYLKKVCDNTLNDTPLKILSLDKSKSGGITKVFVTDTHAKGSVFAMDANDFFNVLDWYVSKNARTISDPTVLDNAEALTVHDQAKENRQSFEHSVL